VLPAFSDSELAQMRPLKEADPQLYAMVKRRGRPRSVAPKQQLTLRLSPKIVADIKASGRGYNARIERVLEEALHKGKFLAACRTWKPAATDRGADHRSDAGRRS
jgi:uncharacterized protein (DUF4415 family)